MSDLKSSIAALQAAIEKSSQPITLQPADEAEIKRIQDTLPLTDVMCDWYSQAAPCEFEMPWAVEMLILFAPADLLEGQAGYRWLGQTGGDVIEDWNPDWVVMGECSGDPIIADTRISETPILMAMHGMGVWEPLLIAPGLSDFLLLLSAWLQSFEEFEGSIQDDNYEIRADFLQAFQARLKGIIPESNLENLLSFF
ncbi:hypothetical protein Pan153_08410 [Gimesia panareensis]|uniref:Knr4/Smi1-like domain-containing protein n=1 Tax=Gimesia panareensis TaxID=2527978 RepID=A0A518FIW9_9PLAN|nr:hypothetical protein [Gimesia panareensis]QDV16220.1 hypothetical protein Pan153_08410 [Gimesia panareensis]